MNKQTERSRFAGKSAFSNPYFVLLLFCTFIMATGQLLLKNGMSKFSFSLPGTIYNLPLICGFLIYGAMAVAFLFILKNMELSIAYPIIGLSFVWVALLSLQFLSETITMLQWLGIASVIAGVSLIGGGTNG
jgi:drug/metabolite transporter (DMT)-like permease